MLRALQVRTATAVSTPLRTPIVRCSWWGNRDHIPNIVSTAHGGKASPFHPRTRVHDTRSPSIDSSAGGVALVVVRDERPQQLPLRRGHPCDGGGRVERNHHLVILHLPSVSEHLVFREETNGREGALVVSRDLLWLTARVV